MIKRKPIGEIVFNTFIPNYQYYRAKANFVKIISVILLLTIFPGLKAFSEKPVPASHSRIGGPEFVSDFHYSGSQLSFLVDLSQLRNAEGIMLFYNLAYEKQIYCMDKHELSGGNAMFTTANSDSCAVKQLMKAAQKETLNQLDNKASKGNVSKAPSTASSCETADVFCGSNAYSFPAGTNSGNAQPGPNYGCLGSTPNPAWYFMNVGLSGEIIIDMSGNPNRDIDFICWGPFTSPTGACTQGLTLSTIVDCSYSANWTETCTIPNAQQGEFYLLMITNFSNQPCEVTFAQSNYGQPGAGLTNCEIVLNCSMVYLSSAPSCCSLSTNTFNVSGTLEFTNPPATGTLHVVDQTSPTQVTQIFTPPFTSPTDYTLQNIPCDGTAHDIRAFFTDSTNCILNEPALSPQPLINASASSNSPVCNGDPLYLDGGLAGMTSYLWTGPNGFTSNLQNPSIPVSGLSHSGTYNLSVISPNGCTYESSTQVVINSNSIGGVISGGTTVYEGISPVTLNLSGNTGSAVYWQKKHNTGQWVDISTASPTYTEIPGSSGTWYYRAIVQNGNCPPVHSSEAVVNVLSRTLSIKVFLQGFFREATGQMIKAQDINGAKFQGDTTDMITVLLAQQNTPYVIEHSITQVPLQQDGTASFDLPSGSVSSYYLVIKHRNSMETWSSIPLSLAIDHSFYDFTDAALKAFGSNMLKLGNAWTIYSGDANQDGIVDGTDMAAIDNASTWLYQGYFAEDVNGDGIVDGTDMLIIDNNSAHVVTVKSPLN
ncbi:MAG: hypothetical protein HXX13_14755 [Bacteroidetes bacterium]|nr:hypothetical protein [Bacteroidota bacterium]